MMPFALGDNMVQIPHGYGSRRVEIQFVDNGWIVTVTNPPPRKVNEVEKMYKALTTILPSINNLGARGMAQGIDEEMDPYKENDESREAKMREKVKLAQDVVEKAFADPVMVQKPFEVYLFLDVEKMMAFLRELVVGAVPSGT